MSQNIASPEKALLALFGILLSGTLMSEDLVIKGWIAGLIGLAMAMGRPRPVAQRAALYLRLVLHAVGFQVVPVLMGGLCPLPQIIEGMRHVEFGSMAQIKGRILPNFATIRRYLPHDHPLGP